MSDATNTHLCNPYNGEQCPMFFRTDEHGGTAGAKQLKPFYCYCKANGRCRSLGGLASWTGNSPTWCPRRRKEASGK